MTSTGMQGRERSGVLLAAGAVVLVGGSVAASSLVGDYPVLGGQGVRYLVAGLLLAGWARVRGLRLPRPTGREWGWLAALAAVGLAGCSVLMIEATRVADPGSVGVVIGAAPLVIVLAGSLAARRRPPTRLLVGACVVAAGAVVAQVGAGGGSFTLWGILLSMGALVGAVGSTVLAAPVLPRLGALAVTVYSCVLAGLMLLALAVQEGLANGVEVVRMPTWVEFGALTYLAIMVTGVVCIAWYAAMERLGTERTGLFNGLIPVASLAAVLLVGAGSVTATQLVGALAVLAGVILGLTRGRPRTADPSGSEPEPTEAGVAVTRR